MPFPLTTTADTAAICPSANHIILLKIYRTQSELLFLPATPPPVNIIWSLIKGESKGTIVVILIILIIRKSVESLKSKEGKVNKNKRWNGGGGDH